MSADYGVHSRTRATPRAPRAGRSGGGPRIPGWKGRDWRDGANGHRSGRWGRPSPPTPTGVAPRRRVRAAGREPGETDEAVAWRPPQGWLIQSTRFRKLRQLLPVPLQELLVDVTVGVVPHLGDLFTAELDHDAGALVHDVLGGALQPRALADLDDHA